MFKLQLCNFHSCRKFKDATNHKFYVFQFLFSLLHRLFRFFARTSLTNDKRINFSFLSCCINCVCTFCVLCKRWHLIIKVPRANYPYTHRKYSASVWDFFGWKSVWRCWREGIRTLFLLRRAQWELFSFNTDFVAQFTKVSELHTTNI
jgi:hypothetical protein